MLCRRPRLFICLCRAVSEAKPVAGAHRASPGAPEHSSQVHVAFPIVDSIAGPDSEKGRGTRNIMSMRTSCAVAAGLYARCLKRAAPCAPQVGRFTPGHSLPLEPLPTRSRANSMASRRDSVCDECLPPAPPFHINPSSLEVTRKEKK